MKPIEPIDRDFDIQAQINNLNNKADEISELINLILKQVGQGERE